MYIPSGNTSYCNIIKSVLGSSVVCETMLAIIVGELLFSARLW